MLRLEGWCPVHRSFALGWHLSGNLHFPPGAREEGPGGALQPLEGASTLQLLVQLPRPLIVGEVSGVSGPSEMPPCLELRPCIPCALCSYLLLRCGCCLLGHLTDQVWPHHCQHELWGVGTPGRCLGALGCCDEPQRGSPSWPQCAQLGLPAQEPGGACGLLPVG